MPDLPLAHVVHLLPGRARLRVPERRGDAAWFAALPARIGAAPGLGSVHTNFRTGSILVSFTGDPMALAAHAVAAGLFRMSADPPPAPGPSPGPPRAGVHGSPRPMQLAAAGLAGLGLYQAARGRALGPASENLWNAYRTLTLLGRPWLAGVFIGAGLLQIARGEILGSAGALLHYAMMARRRGHEPQAAAGPAPPG